MKTFKEFTEKVDENINEASDIEVKEGLFALVVSGGSIGGSNGKPIILGGVYSKIIETSEDEEYIKNKKAERNKSRSAGEKSYYKIKYSVIKISKSAVQQIKYLEDYAAKKASEIEEIE